MTYIKLITLLILLSFSTNLYAPLGEPQQTCVEFKSRAHEVVYWVKHYNLDKNWLRVFVTESGWNFDSPVAIRTNNIMGMCRHNRPTQIGYKQAHKQTVAEYKNLHDSVYDVKLWVELNPPLENESFYDFLKRRRYNPNPEYYNYLKKINISKLWTTTV